jgi:hypothetical protein
VVSHNRTLASKAFSELLDDVPSSDLGVDWKRVRRDLLFLPSSVRRIDEQAWAEWSIDRPISRSDFVNACSQAARGQPLHPKEDRVAIEGVSEAIPRAPMP